MRNLKIFWLLVFAISFSSCATMPSGPSQMSLPGSGKSYDQFRMDDLSCRQIAYEQIGGAAALQSGQDAAAARAVIGTMLGAAIGAAIGSTTGDAGAGAAIGAGTGLLIGTAEGSNYGAVSYYEAQRRYDHSYLQCMYSMGNRIPVYGQFTEPSVPDRWVEYAPPPDYPPPPPPPPMR